MSVQLNHTIVRVRDKHEAAEFFADILGLPPAIPYGPFLVLNLANGVSLDFADDHGAPVPTHYAFLVTEDEFDDISLASGPADWTIGPTRRTADPAR
jgi:catechol 2,3-dioxygenase-like lactoylglutathione lyase family enzyme